MLSVSRLARGRGNGGICMKEILVIMKNLYEAPEKYTESELRSIFGDKDVDKFVQFCFRGNPKYAEKNENNVKIRLTSEGVRAYHKAVSEDRLFSMNEKMVRANQSYALVTIIIGINPLVVDFLKLIPEQYKIWYYVIHVGFLVWVGYSFLKKGSI